MNQKFKVLNLILIVVISISTRGQTKSNFSENYSVSKNEKSLNTVNIQISQFKLKTVDNPSLPVCEAIIYIFKNAVKIDSIHFHDIEPVGGNYGLMIYKVPIENHLIITKYGDYQGLTIIINEKGEKFIMDGGFVCIDRERKLLFSISVSDIYGFTVFDLKSDKIIFSKSDLKENPFEFYKSSKGNYFFKSSSHNSEKDSFYKMHLKKKNILKVDSELGISKYQTLEKLIEWESVKNIYCE
jgi:hypothetical protein